MATIKDLEHAHDVLIRRVAERVDALADQGRNYHQVVSDLDDTLGQGRWMYLVVLDPSVTVGELVTMASVLDTSSTWLLTGREPALAAAD